MINKDKILLLKLYNKNQNVQKSDHLNIKCTKAYKPRWNKFSNKEITKYW